MPPPTSRHEAITLLVGLALDYYRAPIGLRYRHVFAYRIWTQNREEVGERERAPLVLVCPALCPSFG